MPIRLARTRLATALVAASVALAPLVAACGDQAADPNVGTLVITADANCPSTSVTISVDGRAAVQANMRPGQAVRSFQLSPGTHTVAISGFSTTSVPITRNETFTLILRC